MRDRLREDEGYTLVEMLCAALVLILLCMLVGSGFHMAQSSYRSMALRSETQLLLSTLSNALTDELRYADDVSSNADGSLITYRSRLYGENTTLKVDVSGQIYAEALSASPGAAATSYYILPGGAYGGGTWLYGVPPNGFTIGYNAAERLFEVTLVVLEMEMNGSDREFVESGGIQATGTFNVRCLN